MMKKSYKKEIEKKNKLHRKAMKEIDDILDKTLGYHDESNADASDEIDNDEIDDLEVKENWLKRFGKAIANVARKIWRWIKKIFKITWASIKLAFFVICPWHWKKSKIEERKDQYDDEIEQIKSEYTGEIIDFEILDSDEDIDDDINDTDDGSEDESDDDESDDDEPEDSDDEDSDDSDDDDSDEDVDETNDDSDDSEDDDAGEYASESEKAFYETKMRYNKKYAKLMHDDDEDHYGRFKHQNMALTDLFTELLCIDSSELDSYLDKRYTKTQKKGQWKALPNVYVQKSGLPGYKESTGYLVTGIVSSSESFGDFLRICGIDPDDAEASAASDKHTMSYRFGKDLVLTVIKNSTGKTIKANKGKSRRLSEVTICVSKFAKTEAAP